MTIFQERIKAMSETALNAPTLEERSRLIDKMYDYMEQRFTPILTPTDEAFTAWYNEVLPYEVGDILFLRLNPEDDNFLICRDDDQWVHENSYPLKDEGYCRVHRVRCNTTDIEIAKKVINTLYHPQGMKVRALAIFPESVELVTYFEALY